MPTICDKQWTFFELICTSNSVSVLHAYRVPYIKTKPLHPSQNQIDKNRKDGSCTFEINVCINYELYSIFMSYESGVEILSPRKARDYMKAQFEEALKQYQRDEK